MYLMYYNFIPFLQLGPHGGQGRGSVLRSRAPTTKQLPKKMHVTKGLLSCLWQIYTPLTFHST